MMSEDSEGTMVKPEPEIDVKDTTILTNIPMVGDHIDLRHAVVIMPDNSDGNLSINTVHDSNVVVVASMTSDGELITPDMEPMVQEQPEPESPEKEVEPRDPNTCLHCDRVFRSQTVSLILH